MADRFVPSYSSASSASDESASDTLVFGAASVTSALRATDDNSNMLDEEIWTIKRRLVPSPLDKRTFDSLEAYNRIVAVHLRDLGLPGRCVEEPADEGDEGDVESDAAEEDSDELWFSSITFAPKLVQKPPARPSPRPSGSLKGSDDKRDAGTQGGGKERDTKPRHKQQADNVVQPRSQIPSGLDASQGAHPPHPATFVPTKLPTASTKPPAAAAKSAAQPSTAAQAPPPAVPHPAQRPAPPLRKPEASTSTSSAPRNPSISTPPLPVRQPTSSSTTRSTADTPATSPPRPPATKRAPASAPSNVIYVSDSSAESSCISDVFPVDDDDSSSGPDRTPRTRAFALWARWQALRANGPEGEQQAVDERKAVVQGRASRRSVWRDALAYREEGRRRRDAERREKAEKAEKARSATKTSSTVDKTPSTVDKLPVAASASKAAPTVPSTSDTFAVPALPSRPSSRLSSAPRARPIPPPPPPPYVPPTSDAPQATTHDSTVADKPPSASVTAPPLAAKASPSEPRLPAPSTSTSAPTAHSNAPSAASSRANDSKDLQLFQPPRTPTSASLHGKSTVELPNPPAAEPKPNALKRSLSISPPPEGTKYRTPKGFAAAEEKEKASRAAGGKERKAERKAEREVERKVERKGAKELKEAKGAKGAKEAKRRKVDDDPRASASASTPAPAASTSATPFATLDVVPDSDEERRIKEPLFRPPSTSSATSSSLSQLPSFRTLTPAERSEREEERRRVAQAQQLLVEEQAKRQGEEERRKEAERAEAAKRLAYSGRRVSAPLPSTQPQHEEEQQDEQDEQEEVPEQDEQAQARAWAWWAQRREQQEASGSASTTSAAAAAAGPSSAKAAFDAPPPIAPRAMREEREVRGPRRRREREREREEEEERDFREQGRGSGRRTLGTLVEEEKE